MLTVPKSGNIISNYKYPKFSEEEENNASLAIRQGMRVFGLGHHIVSTTRHVCEGASKLGPAIDLSMCHPGHEGMGMDKGEVRGGRGGKWCGHKERRV